jgi:hypothetical protein
MLELTATTTPTLDTVRERLEAGAYVLTKNTFAIEDLAAQVFQTQAIADRYVDVIDAKAGTTIRDTLVAARRLLELGGWAGAERTSLSVEQIEQTSKQAQLRRNLIDARDAVVRLARDKNVDARLFSVNFGTGDATNTLPAAYVFASLLKKHGDKLGTTPLVKEILAEVDADVAALANTEVLQEQKKRDVLVPGALRSKARHAVYELLLHISRTGFAVFRRDVEVREQFRLAVLHKTQTAVVADDDDAPIAVVAEEGDVTPAAATVGG